MATIDRAADEQVVDLERAMDRSGMIARLFLNLNIL